MEWAIWLSVLLALLVFPWGRRIVRMLWACSIGLLLLLLLSEPDLD